MKLIDKDAIPWDVEGVGEIPVITKEEVDEMPTVDAVPVVRCKDCRYYDYGENPSESWSLCIAHINRYFQTCADNFCSWAERKEE